MNLQCPVCRAANSSGSACRRCKADLSLLVDLESNRSRHMAVARYALDGERFDEALDELVRVAALRDGSDAQRLRACTFLLATDFSSALAEYQRAKN